MSVSTSVDQARTRVQAEQDVVAEEIDAFDSFTDRVADLPTDPTPSSVGTPATAGARRHTDSTTDDRCRTVHTAFAETIRSRGIVDADGSEFPLETVCDAFTDATAVALAPTTEASFTPDLEQSVVSKTQDRRAEATALHEAPDREEVRLTDVGAAVDGITAWIVEANETPPTDLGFDAYRRWHETLAGSRDRCEALDRRQQFLRETTNEGVEAGIRHERLIPHLHRDVPVCHPLPATAAKLDATCGECRRIVRDHLVRRVRSMDDGVRRRRACAWAWMSLALFGDGDEGTGTGVEPTAEAGYSADEPSDGPETK
jgi:hypothetical protein